MRKIEDSSDPVILMTRTFPYRLTLIFSFLFCSSISFLSLCRSTFPDCFRVQSLLIVSRLNFFFDRFALYVSCLFRPSICLVLLSLNVSLSFCPSICFYAFVLQFSLIVLPPCFPSGFLPQSVLIVLTVNFPSSN
jgi:hypothetical protein